MKTTVDIPDSLLDEVRKTAAREGRTMREFVEEGLRKVLAERKKTAIFRLRKASFKGRGLRPEIAGGSWDRIRDLAYEGHGG
jgi:hypothetical protein